MQEHIILIEDIEVGVILYRVCRLANVCYRPGPAFTTYKEASEFIVDERRAMGEPK